jgi:hypothetical protein
MTRTLSTPKIQAIGVSEVIKRRGAVAIASSNRLITKMKMLESCSTQIQKGRWLTI